MTMVARILGIAAVTGALAAGLGLALLKPAPQSSDAVVVVFLAGVGAVVGAVAGAAREIVAAWRREPPARAETVRG